MARRRRFSLGGILSGQPEIGAAILFLLLALALGLAGGYLLARRYPPPAKPPAPAAPSSELDAPFPRLSSLTPLAQSLSPLRGVRVA